jgi:hypothetical protein
VVILPAIGPLGLAVPNLNISFLRREAPGEDNRRPRAVMKALQAARGRRAQPWGGERIRSDRLCDSDLFHSKRVRFLMVSLHHISKPLFLLH